MLSWEGDWRFEDQAFFHPRFTSTKPGSRYDSGCESQQVARSSGGSKDLLVLEQSALPWFGDFAATRSFCNRFTLGCSALDFNLHLRWRQSGFLQSKHFLVISWRCIAWRPLVERWPGHLDRLWQEMVATDGDLLSLKSELQTFLPWVGQPVPSQMPRSILVQRNTPVLFQDGYHTAEVNILRYAQSGTLEAFDQAILSVPESALLVDLKPPWAATVWGVIFSKAMSHTPARAQVQQNGGLCLRPGLHQHATSIDLFSGIGGWQFGYQWAKELNNFDQPSLRFSVELDPATAQAAAQVVKATTWIDTEIIDPRFQHLVDNDDHHIFITSVSNRILMQKLSIFNLTTACGSPSCQPCPWDTDVDCTQFWDGISLSWLIGCPKFSRARLFWRTFVDCKAILIGRF